MGLRHPGITESAPSTTPDFDAFLQHPMIAAKRREERILSIRLAAQVADDPEAFRRIVIAPDEAEEPEGGSGPLEVDKRERVTWDALASVENTQDIILKKAQILFKLIERLIPLGPVTPDMVLKRPARIGAAGARTGFGWVV